MFRPLEVGLYTAHAPANRGTSADALEVVQFAVISFSVDSAQLGGNSLGELDLLRFARAERRGAELLEFAFKTVQLRVVGTLANDSGDIGPKSFLNLLWICQLWYCST